LSTAVPDRRGHGWEFAWWRNLSMRSYRSYQIQWIPLGIFRFEGFSPFSCDMFPNSYSWSTSGSTSGRKKSPPRLLIMNHSRNIFRSQIWVQISLDMFNTWGSVTALPGDLGSLKPEDPPWSW
jgi:hypothetical protein